MSNSTSTKECGNCSIKHSSAELSGPQQLCKECRRTLPQSKCSFCCIDFYVIGTLNKNKPACKKCSEYYNKFGDPKSCDWCKSPSAFKGSKCFQCKSAEEKYGKPGKCETCKNLAYFDKGLEARKKVDNKSLCLLCTLKYKKELHRCGKFKRSSAEIVSNKASGVKVKRAKDDKDASSSAHRQHKKRSVKECGIQADLCGHSQADDKSPADKNNSMEAILLTNQLKEEIAALKRQLDTRDRSIIEKGKEYNELRTEMWESDKKLKKKLQDQSLDHEHNLDEMQNIIRNLKSQNSKLTKLLKQGSRKSTPPVALSQSLLEPEPTDST